MKNSSVRFTVCAVVAIGLSACGGAATSSNKKPVSQTQSTTIPPAPAPEPIQVHVCWDARRQVEKGQVVRVEIRGVRAPALLCERFPVRPGDPLETATTDVNIRALYGEGRVEDVVVYKEKHEDGVVVVYDVKIRRRVRTVNVPPVPGLDAAVANELVAEAPLWEDTARFDNLVREATDTLILRGYRHSNISVETAPAGDDEVNVTLAVDPGVRTTVGAFNVDGFSPERWTELSSILRTKIGEPYNQELLERDVLVMTADLFDRGLVSASFSTPQIVESPDGATVDILLKVSEGPVFKVGQVKFVGDLAVPASTYLRDTWHTKKGAIFSRKRIVDDVESVKRFQVSRGAAADVDLETTLNAKSSTVDLIVRIKRQP